MKGKTFLGLVSTILTMGNSYGMVKQPNIIIFIADDISMSDLGCYGHPVIKTPHIDALAKDGVRFTNTFLTASSSSPSRASIITGRYPHNTGACELHSPIGEEQTSVAEILRNHGYYTAQAGKWHFGSSPSKPEGPLLRAFDRTGGHSKDGGGDSGSEMWVPYLKERPKDKPFFMWFAAHDAHRGWDKDQSMTRYTPETVKLPRFFVDDLPTREDFASYYYEVSRFDHFVGEVVKELKAQNEFDNTLIVVMADNGRPFPRAKTRLIPDGIKTPFVIRFPPATQKKGVICNSLISVIDLAPTITEVVGIPESPTFQGRSFLSLLSHPNKHFRNYVFAEHNWHDFEAYERMVCDGKYILIENKRPWLTAEGAIDVMGGKAGKSLKNAYRKGVLNELQADVFVIPRESIELYEYNKDIFQISNLASKKKKHVTRLLNVLRQWQNETADTYPEMLTPDWYSREDLKRNDKFGIRGEMPGSSKKANLVNCGGPF